MPLKMKRSELYYCSHPFFPGLGSSPEPLRKLLLYDGWRVEEKNNVWERIFSGAAILAYFASIPAVCFGLMGSKYFRCCLKNLSLSRFNQFY